MLDLVRDGTHGIETKMVFVFLFFSFHVNAARFRSVYSASGGMEVASFEMFAS